MVVKSTNQDRCERNRLDALLEHQIRHAVEVLDKLAHGVNNTPIRLLNEKLRPGVFFVPVDDLEHWHNQYPPSIFKYEQVSHDLGNRQVSYYEVTVRQDVKEEYYAAKKREASGTAVAATS